MSYRAGTAGLEQLGIDSGPPTLTCDRCGRRLEVRPVRGGAPAWLLDGRAPMGWTLIRAPDGTRYDFCPAHQVRRR